MSSPEIEVSAYPALIRLFEALPLEDAMPCLVVREPAATELLTLASAATQELPTPELRAGIWLYVDDLHRSHEISQSIQSSTGAFWHAIMHRREGDFWNSKYWWRQVGKHPALEGDPYAFVDLVEADREANHAALVGRQRAEWRGLFEWCLKLPSAH